MPRPRAKTTVHALELIAQRGMAPYAAAQEAGASPNRVYVALRNDRLARATKARRRKSRKD